MAQAYPRPRAIHSCAGRPVSLVAGVFTGRTVRVELEEIQKADLCRKYTRIDRRSLDPPPVVLCRFLDVLLDGTGGIVERKIDPEKASMDAICHVDLFPIPDEGSASDNSTSASNASLSTLQGRIPRFEPTGTSALPLDALPFPHPTPYATPGSLPAAHFPGPSQEPLASTSRTLLPAPSIENFETPRVAVDDVVAEFKSFPIYESSKRTHMLAGETFTQAAVIDYNGEKSAMFVFRDLAVKEEGTFVLRYHMISLFSVQEGDAGVSILSECYGGPFKVYPTKHCPALRPSTDLTKLVAAQGVRVVLRDHEYKRRRGAKPRRRDKDVMPESEEREAESELLQVVPRS
ncbi:velvet factor-domain-containing protein [Trametes meyenii]|nr:velvet factor-domain-containing protein [Trametes meyenii]